MLQFGEWSQGFAGPSYREPRSICMPPSFAVPGRVRSTGRFLLPVVLALGLAGAAGAPPASASGGADIASAPQLVFDGITSGGGKRSEFWRMQLVAGDAVTFRWDQQTGETPVASLYDPSVDDYRLATASSLVSREVSQGKSEFQIVSPFSGNGILRITANFSKAPFSFVASVGHKTAVVISKPPSLVSKPSTRFRVSARVVAEAGTATGKCLFERVVGTKATQLGSVPVTNGVCRTMARTNGRAPVRFRVSYLPDDGWQESDSMSAAVRTRKAKRASRVAQAAKKKRVCQKVVSHGKLTNYCRTIDTLAGTDCKHPFKVFYFFAGPGVKVEWLRNGPPGYGTTPRVTWARTDRGVVCKVETKQDGRPDWSSTAQRGTHDLESTPGAQFDGSIPNRVRSIVLWVRKAHRK